MPNLREHAGAVTIAVRVVTRSKRAGLELLPDGQLQVRVTAPPVDGVANREVCRAFADVFQLPISRVEIVRGARSRQKDLRLHGIKLEAARQRLSEVLKVDVSADCGG